jgi:hypothetical protein
MVVRTLWNLRRIGYGRCERDQYGSGSAYAGGRSRDSTHCAYLAGLGTLLSMLYTHQNKGGAMSELKGIVAEDEPVLRVQLRRSYGRVDSDLRGAEDGFERARSASMPPSCS